MERRKFIRNLTIGSSVVITPLDLAATSVSDQPRKKVNFGIITDLHTDVMHDGDYRLRTFLNATKNKELDFIVQLGDFCQPNEANKNILKLFNSHPGDKYHVIGNHDFDSDNGLAPLDVVKNFYGLKSTYYSFDASNFHFIILDGNEKDPNYKQGYPRYIGENQQLWLKDDLQKTKLQVVVFVHQPLGSDEAGLINRVQIREIFEQANKSAGFKKVIACINGHTHIDQNELINDVHYIQINSSSYRWLGTEYAMTGRYSEKLDNCYPDIRYTAPYKDAIYAFVEISDKDIIIKGKNSEFVGPHPKDMGYKGSNLEYTKPDITDKKIKF